MTSGPASSPGGAFVAIAVHHAVPEHRPAFLDFCRLVRDGMAGTPGLLEFKVCSDPAGTYLAGFSRWESVEAFQAALAEIRRFEPLRRPEWSSRPDDVITLVEV